MSSPRAVILCVLPANNNFHNSAILTMAKDEACDPQGFRTLGIITKPDLTDKGSAARLPCKFLACRDLIALRFSM